MSPKGRPTQEKRDKRFEIRLSSKTYSTLEECAEKLEITKAQVIHKGIALVKAEIEEKEQNFQKSIDFSSHIMYNDYGLQKGGGNIVAEKKKLGRPTTNPKFQSRQVRLDAECKEILEKYCKQEGVTEAEGIRRGIKKLRAEIK